MRLKSSIWNKKIRKKSYNFHYVVDNLHWEICMISLQLQTQRKMRGKYSPNRNEILY